MNGQSIKMEGRNEGRWGERGKEEQGKKGRPKGGREGIYTDANENRNAGEALSQVHS